MPDDLPIYSDSVLRTRLQFADLERLKGIDTSAVWEKADKHIAQMEGGSNVREARTAFAAQDKATLLGIHATVFRSRDGAGQMRKSDVKPQFRGQDCPPPQFIDRSLENFASWLTAESFAEIHPIEKAALVLTRIVDIWPFDYGNLTVAVIFANGMLARAALPPFFVQAEHLKEFNKIIGQAMTIETQPLVNAIYATVKREMETLERR